MAYEKRSKKLLITATALTIMTIVIIGSVYAAAILGIFQGGPVSVGGVSLGTVSYSGDNSLPGTWTGTLQVSSSSDPWYVRIQVSGYTGPVTINWQLQVETAPSIYTDVSGASVTTSVSLIGSSQYIYASNDGSNGSNQNWGNDCLTNGTYIVAATVEST
jgi:hypothetical protein